MLNSITFDFDQVLSATDKITLRHSIIDYVDDTIIADINNFELSFPEGSLIIIDGKLCSYDMSEEMINRSILCLVQFLKSNECRKLEINLNNLELKFNPNGLDVKFSPDFLETWKNNEGIRKSLEIINDRIFKLLIIS